jgi:hypothetical protein
LQTASPDDGGGDGGGDGGDGAEVGDGVIELTDEQIERLADPKYFFEAMYPYKASSAPVSASPRGSGCLPAMF